MPQPPFRFPRRAGRSLLLCALALGLGAGLSQAATPKAGEWWGETKPSGGNDSSAMFRVQGNWMLPHRFTGKWQVIVAPTSFKCNEALLQLPIKRLRIKRGRFTYHGKAVDAAGNKPTGVKGQLDWIGRFPSATKVRGKVRLRTKVTPVFDSDTYKYKLKKKPCDTGWLKWSGARLASAQ